MAVKGDQEYRQDLDRQSNRLRDSRNASERFFDYFSNPKYKNVIVFSILVFIVSPTVGAVFFWMNFLVYKMNKKNFPLWSRAPLNKPIYARDLTDPSVRVKKRDSTLTKVDYEYGKPGGIIFYGNLASTNEEVWLNNDVQRQHLMFFGTTGAGKTFSLTGVVASTLVIGSGFTASDGKGDLGLPRNIVALAYRVNRINDFYLLTYLTGGQTLWKQSAYKITNNFNPFGNASNSDVIELIKSLLDGEGDIWAKRADTFVSSLAKPVVYLRDHGYLKLSINTFSKYMTLENLGLLIADERIPDNVKVTLRDFVEKLPGMKPEFMAAIMKGQSIQSSTVYDQLGYVTMQIINVINDLMGDFRHIFSSIVGELDMEDAIRNNRIVLVLLPALEKAPTTIANLGRIVVAAQKSMLARNLGDKFEGDLDDHLKQRPTAANVPYLCVYDEVGYYFVEGLGAILAQARSTGVSILLAAQDLPAMKKLSEKIAKEVETAWGNTNTKIAGRVEDSETAEKVIKRADKHFTTEATSVEADTSTIFASVKEKSYSVQERDRLRPSDIFKLTEGEVIIQHKTEIFRVDMVDVFTQDLQKRLINVSLTELLPKFTFDTSKASGISKGMRSMSYILEESIVDSKKYTQERLPNSKLLTDIKNLFTSIKSKNATNTVTGISTILMHSILTGKRYAQVLSTPEPDESLIVVTEEESPEHNQPAIINKMDEDSFETPLVANGNSNQYIELSAVEDKQEKVESFNENLSVAKNILTYTGDKISTLSDEETIIKNPTELAEQILDINLFLAALDRSDEDEFESGTVELRMEEARQIAKETVADVNDLIKDVSYNPVNHLANNPSDAINVLSELKELFEEQNNTSN
jgi:hypothetical protein